VVGMDRGHLRRRLTAVLIADVVGYSRLMGVDEEGTHLRLAGYVKDLIEPKIVGNRGRLIRTAGDGFLVEFRERRGRGTMRPRYPARIG